MSAGHPEQRESGNPFCQIGKNEFSRKKKGSRPRENLAEAELNRSENREVTTCMLTLSMNHNPSRTKEQEPRGRGEGAVAQREE